MSRKRRPNAETTEQDKQIAGGAAQMLRAIASRHDSGVLLGAAHLIDRFVDSPSPVSKPRVRKPKAAPSSGWTDNAYRDGKSAAANDVDARELAHHPV